MREDPGLSLCAHFAHALQYRPQSSVRFEPARKGMSLASCRKSVLHNYSVYACSDHKVRVITYTELIIKRADHATLMKPVLSDRSP